MKTAIVTAVVVIGLVVLFSSAYTVSETEQVVVTQFGEPIGKPITAPGLHFKVPFVQKVNRFDKRWLEWDGDADEMPTKEKTYIWVDTYARWRIADPLKFFQSVHDERAAQSRLDDIIMSETRNVIAAHNLIEVVRTTNRPFTLSAEHKDMRKREGEPEQEHVQLGRQKLTRMILQKASEAMPNFGIQLVDVQFQRVNYTKTVEQKIYARMISERKRIAERYRSEGKGEAARIRGEKERDLNKIQSEAYMQVQQIKGQADAKATDIYAAAHSLDPSLYRLLKSLDTYKHTIDNNSVVILSTDSDLFAPLVKMNVK